MYFRTRASSQDLLSSVLFRATLGVAFLGATACGSGDDGGSSEETAPIEEEVPPMEEQPGDTAEEFPADMLPDEVVHDLPLVVPTSDRDMAIFSDIVEVQPSEDVTFCTFTEVILDEATIFGETFGAQSPTGHHSILQYASVPQEPGTGSCGEAMDGQILLGGTGGKAIADEATLPTNFGVEVPAGAQLVINHHWINTTTDVVEGQAMMLARPLERGGDTVLAGNMIMIGLGWEVPANAPLSYTTECSFQEDVPYVMALGHMHEWGTNVSIEVDRAGGGTESLIDLDWTPEAATGAGGNEIFSLEDPFMIHGGDTVRLTCQWENDTDEALGFPREMCIFFGYTIGANYVCANGAWLTAEQATSAGMGSTDITQHL